MNRVGTIELIMWRGGRPITRPFRTQHQTHQSWAMNHCLPPDGQNLPQYSLIEVEVRNLMPIGQDWQLLRVRTVFDKYLLGEQTLALRFADDPDEWPTAVQPLIIPMFDQGGMTKTGFETWYLTLRGDGAADVA